MRLAASKKGVDFTINFYLLRVLRGGGNWLKKRLESAAMLAQTWWGVKRYVGDGYLFVNLLFPAAETSQSNR